MPEGGPDEPSLEELVAEEIAEIEANLGDDEDAGEAVYELFQELSEPAYEAIRDEMETELEDWRSDLEGFRSRLHDDWEKPFDLLEAFIIYCRECGMLVNQTAEEIAVKENDLTFLALNKLHVRGLQISREILVLLKNGFADGAHARWRGLHEIAAVSMFIKLAGQETAKRFMLHSTIDDFHQAKATRAGSMDYGIDEPNDEEMEELTEQRQRLLDAFGTEYDGLWGWAAHALDTNNPRFKDIEEAAGLGHHRPYYKFASKVNIHAGSRGTNSQLGMMANRPHTTASGPTNYGFVLPGTHTAISLQQVTTSLLTYVPNIESMISLAVTERFVDDIQSAFPVAQEKIETRDKESWDQFIEEKLEDNLDEFLEEYEPASPPTYEINLDDEVSEE